MTYLIYGHQKVGADVRQVMPVVPTFRYDFHQTFGLRLGRPGLWLDSLAANLAFYRDLRRCLGSCKPGWIVLMPMASHRQLLGWGMWLRTRQPRRAPTVILIFRLNLLDIGDPERGADIRRVVIFAFRAFRILARGRRVRLATDSDRLAREYGEVTTLPVEVFPIPHTDAIELEVATCRDRRGENVRFVMLGDVREEKGHRLLVEAIERLHEQGDLTGMEFVLQCHAGRYWQGYTAAYLGALEHLDLQCVQVVRDALGMRDYYRLVGCADVVVLPYRRSTYSARTSGPLVEAFAAGKPVVATAGTWMADQVARTGAGVTFRDGDAEDLARTLVAVRDSYGTLATRAEANRSSWVGVHNPDAFLSKLLDGQPSEAP